MDKSDWLSLLEKIIETTPELITAVVGYLTYKELKNGPKNSDRDN